jgi:hypothetical protein
MLLYFFPLVLPRVFIMEVVVLLHLCYVAETMLHVVVLQYCTTLLIQRWRVGEGA